MRCPKCGYISFDYQDSCGNCATSLAGALGEIQGTVRKVQAPNFLGALFADSGGGFGEPPEEAAHTEQPHAAEEDADVELSVNDLVPGVDEGEGGIALGASAEAEEDEDDVVDLASFLGDEEEETAAGERLDRVTDDYVASADVEGGLDLSLDDEGELSLESLSLEDEDDVDLSLEEEDR